jgi:hypothetical protein
VTLVRDEQGGTYIFVVNLSVSVFYSENCRKSVDVTLVWANHVNLRFLCVCFVFVLVYFFYLVSQHSSGVTLGYSSSKNPLLFKHILAR